MKPKTKQTKKNYIYINDMSSKLCENIVFQAKQNKTKTETEGNEVITIKKVNL